MKSYHLNFGHIFARPYESEYSMVRRFLTANPGINYNLLRTILLTNYPDGFGPSDRILANQIRPDMVRNYVRLSKNSSRRQCPICAKQLYHTDLYCLKWLTHCPIHHCEITTTCPDCHKPWPDIYSIDKSDCPSCGIPKIEDITINQFRTNYRPIEYISEFISQSPEDDGYHLDAGGNCFLPWEFDYGESNWWSNITIESTLFPSYQYARKRKISQRVMQRENITLRNIKMKSSPLLSIEDQSVYKNVDKGPYHVSCIKIDNDNKKTLIRRWIDNYYTMKYIISWVRKKTISHKIYISDYRYREQLYFIDYPMACPYCMAISIWFFMIASGMVNFGKRTIRRTNFFMGHGEPQYHNVAEPYLEYSNGKHHFLDVKFNSWFYRRGLEIQFINILSDCLSWIQRVNIYKFRMNGEQYCDSIEPRQVTGRDYASAIEGGKFYFYYENEHPLEEDDEFMTDFIRRQCRDFHEFIENYFKHSRPFRYEIPSSELTFSTFYDINRYYRRNCGRLRGV